jgi:hypothetical protein
MFNMTSFSKKSSTLSPQFILKKQGKNFSETPVKTTFRVVMSFNTTKGNVVVLDVLIEDNDKYEVFIFDCIVKYLLFPKDSF